MNLFYNKKIVLNLDDFVCMKKNSYNTFAQGIVSYVINYYTDGNEIPLVFDTEEERDGIFAAIYARLVKN